ncbi:MAG: sigma-70 family RNA polymerase sigma factor [Bdellovibrionaceae bacterium]|nr:sigma-70 family RNA polymerase sigma factor [Pseudobdellovibrionaceae bacterium]
MGKTNKNLTSLNLPIKPQSSEQATLIQYMKEVSQYPVLDRKQETEIATKFYETKDPKYAHILVQSNLRFVIKVASEYAKFGNRLLELIQEGNVGLMTAVQEFNPYKNIRLITYAVWWIRGYILEYLMKQHSMVKIGTTNQQKKIFYALQKELKKLGSLQTPFPQLAQSLNVTEKEIITMQQRLTSKDISLDTSSKDDHLDQSVPQTKAITYETPESLLEKKEITEKLKQKLQELKHQLNPKELYILKNRTLSSSPHTLKAIGEHYGTSKEAVRQMETRLLQKIKSTLLYLK